MSPRDRQLPCPVKLPDAPTDCELCLLVGSDERSLLDGANRAEVAAGVRVDGAPRENSTGSKASRHCDTKPYSKMRTAPHPMKGSVVPSVSH